MFFFKRLLFFPVHVLDSAGGAGKGGGGVVGGALLKLVCCMTCWLLDRAWCLLSKS